MTFNFVPGTNVKPAGWLQVTNATLAAAAALTAPTLDKANAAVIQNDPLTSTQAVRYTDDGTTPDASTGIVLNVGDTLQYTGDLTALKFIRVASGAQLGVLFYKYGSIGE